MATGELPIPVEAYLGRAYMAWLSGDRQGVLEALQASAKRAPYHSDVQQMYNSFVSLEAALPVKDLSLKPLR